MNGKLQGIIVCGVVCACLGGTMVYLNSTAGKDNGGGDSSSSITTSESTVHSHSESEEKLTVLNSETKDISSVFVKNSNGEFTLNNPDSGKSNPNIDKLNGVNQNSSLIKSMLENTAVLEASKLAEEKTDDLKKYGLDKPAAAFTVKYSDGKKVTVQIGDESVDGELRYFKLSNEDKIYMASDSKLAYYTESVTEFVSNSLIPAQSDDEGNTVEFGKETIVRKDLDYKVVFENDPVGTSAMASAQVMTEPVFGYLNLTVSSDVTHGMWGLTASSCAVVKPNDEQKKKYGLTDPECTVNLKGKDYDYTLKIGNPVYGEQNEISEDSAGDKEIVGYYCTVEGVDGTDCIYVLAKASLPWVSFNPNEIVSNIIISSYLVDLDKVTIETSDKNYEYSIKSNGGSDDSEGEDGQTVDVTEVTCGGKKLDVDNFKSLYQYMISCPTAQIYFKEPKEKDKYLTVTVYPKVGQSKTLEFYKESSRRSVLKIDGKTSYRVENTWVDTLIKNAENVVNGKAVSDTY